MNCRKEFIAKKSQIDSGQGKCCSHKCSYQWKTSAILLDPEIKQRAIEKRMESIALNGTKHKTGPENPCWKGGPEAARARGSDKAREQCRRYRKENPEWAREQGHSRRGRIRGQRLPRGTVKRIGELQRWKCAICKIKIVLNYHIDHIKPVSKGGEHIPENIQLLCPTCNVRKSAKDPIAYMQERGFLL